MPLDCRIVSNRKVTRFELRGAADYFTMKRLVVDLADACERHRTAHVLGDVRRADTSRVAVTDVFPLVMHVMRHWPRGLRRAGVVYRYTGGRDLARFFEVCARVNGARIGVFRDVKSAARWLGISLADARDGWDEASCSEG